MNLYLRLPKKLWDKILKYKGNRTVESLIIDFLNDYIEYHEELEKEREDSNAELP